VLYVLVDFMIVLASAAAATVVMEALRVVRRQAK
jgi:hypothetical protein